MGKLRTGPVPKVIQDTIVKQVAALAITGAPKSAICEQLKMSDHFVRRIFKDERFKSELKAIGDEAVEVAKNTMKARVASLSDDVMHAITMQLREKYSIEAVKVALRILGFGEEQQGSAVTNLQVVLPGARQEESIDAEHRVQDETN